MNDNKNNCSDCEVEIIHCSYAPVISTALTLLNSSGVHVPPGKNNN